MGTWSRLLLVMIVGACAAGADEMSRRADAVELVRLSVPLAKSRLGDSLITAFAAQYPALAGQEETLRGMLDTYLADPSYERTGAVFVVKFFSEDEVKLLLATLKDGGAGFDDERLRAVQDKYRRFLDKVASMLIEYLSAGATPDPASAP